MKKKFLLSLAGLLSLVATVGTVSSCTPTTSSSSIVEPVELTSLAIANKSELQERWLTTGNYRTIEITSNPAILPPQALQSGLLTVTSSDPTIIAATGLTITPQKSGTATITVKYGDKSDSVDITVYDDITMIPTNDVIALSEADKTITFAVSSTSNRNSLTDYEWSSSDPSIATVKDGVVTGIKAGTTSIKVVDKAFSGNTAEYEITVLAEKEVITPIKEVDSNKIKAAFTVDGEVVAKTTKGFLLSDGEAAIYVYLNTAPTYAIGDHVKVRNVEYETGKFSSSTYNGLPQFTADAEVVLLSSEFDGTIPEAKDLDVTTANSFAGTISTASVQKYKWSTVTSELDDYTTINLDGSSIVMEPSYMPDEFKISPNGYYEVEAYFGGYSSSHGYAAMYITKVTAKEVTENLLSVSSTDVNVYVGTEADVNIVGLVPEGSSDKVAVKSADEKIATIAPDAKDDNVYNITGVAEGKTTITVTLGSVTKTINVTVAKKLDVTAIKDITNGKDALVVGKVLGKAYDGILIGDAAGNESKIYVYLGSSSSVLKTINVGDYVKVTGTPTDRYSNSQFGQDATVEIVDDGPQFTDSAIEWTDTQLNEWKGDIGHYVTLKGVDVTISGNYTNFSYGSVSKGSIKTSTGVSLENGKKYDITGYTLDINGGDYRSILVTEAVVSADQGGEDPEPTDSLNTASEVLASSNGADVENLKGVIRGIYSRGYILQDETGIVNVYTNTAGYDSTLNIGDYVSASGKTSNYQGVMQVDTNRTKVTKLDETAPSLTAPTPTPWTATEFDAYTINDGLEYVSLENVTLATSQYSNFSVSGSSKTGAFQYPLESFDITSANNGKTADLVGYVVGMSSERVNFVVTDITFDEGGEDPNPEPTPLPTPVDTTVADLIAKDATDDSNLYKVSGIFEAKKNDKYGNGYLTDPETGDSIMIYGSTTSAVEDVFSIVDGALDFENPANGIEELADINNGDYISMTVKYECFNGTDEIMGVITSHEASDRKYAVDIAATENGSVTADKKEYAYGETVTLTVSANEGYKVQDVVVKNAQGTQVQTTNDGAKYTFAASVVNDVTVTFAEDVPIAGDVKYDVAAAATGFGNNSYEEHTFSVNGVTFSVDHANYSKNDTGTAWEESLLVLGRNFDTCTLEITTQQAASAIAYHGFNWNKDKSTIKVYYYDDSSSSWVEATSAAFTAGSTSSEEVNKKTTETFSATKFRIVREGNGARFGLKDITFTY